MIVIITLASSIPRISQEFRGALSKLPKAQTHSRWRRSDLPASSLSPRRPEKDSHQQAAAAALFAQTWVSMVVRREGTREVLGRPH